MSRRDSLQRGGRLPEGWPDYQCVKAVEALANARWDGNEYGLGWMHVMSDPFPGNQPPRWREHAHPNPARLDDRKMTGPIIA
jgi:hypothetical protein